MWLRLRRAALIGELLGHDAAAQRATVVTAAFGCAAVPFADQAMEMAIQSVWKAFCGKGLARFLPVGAIVTGLVDTQGKVAAEIKAEFEPGRRPILKEEWDVPLEKVSISAAIGASVHGAMRLSCKAATAAAPSVERAAGAAAEKMEDAAAQGIAKMGIAASSGIASVRGLFKK